jgi:site-specific recombinase XerC
MLNEDKGYRCPATSRWLTEVRAQGFGARTVNVRTQALRSFGRWLVDARRATQNPFLGLRPRNVEADRKRVRRALTAEEAARLLEAARCRPLADAEAAAAQETAYRREHGKPSSRGKAAVPPFP